MDLEKITELLNRELNLDTIHDIWKIASQPRENSWRFWYELLHKRCGIPPEQLLEYKPSIDVICEPMFGRMVRLEGGGQVRVLPPLRGHTGRISMYLECLDIIWKFRQPNDIMRLAVYRRQVSHRAGLAVIDQPFFALVERDMRRLSKEQREDLAQRMPPDSEIQRALVSLCSPHLLAMAAE